MAIPLVALFFTMGGALENMQEEIIPLIPVLLLLGRGIGVDALTVVAMSAGGGHGRFGIRADESVSGRNCACWPSSAACWWRNSRRDLDRRVCDLGGLDHAACRQESAVGRSRRVRWSNADAS